VSISTEARSKTKGKANKQNRNPETRSMHHWKKKNGARIQRGKREWFIDVKRNERVKGKKKTRKKLKQRNNQETED